MSINQSNDKMTTKNVLNDSDASEETVACQEEIYLETREETLRTTLISEDPFAYEREEAVRVDCCLAARSPEEELDLAAEELITGDSDDPPLSEGAIAEVLRMTSKARRLDA